MNWKWIFVAFCLIAIINLCEAGDKGKAKKKSKAQLEKEAKKKTAGATTTTQAAAPTKEDEDEAKGKNKKKKHKREVPNSFLQSLGSYPSLKENSPSRYSSA